MILNNVTAIANSNPVTIPINTGPLTRDLQLTFNNALVFPGLVNSHDHLDFNLFPQLGSNIYNNYTEWGTYIHQQYKDDINAVLKVPLDLRVEWGIYKNLLGGVTTVVNHGQKIVINNPPINVVQTHCLHSVQFEKFWKVKLNNPLKRKQPVVTHVGEGCDTLATKEIDELLHWNLWHKKIIGVHGIAMSVTQAKKFKALVWCPESNFFLLNKTAQVDRLKKHTNILFGTDSTLTGNWNIWDHLRLARKTNLLTDEELYNSLNKCAIDTWQLNNYEKDMVVVKNPPGSSYLESFFAVDPKDILLVLKDGNVRLFDNELLTQLDGLAIKEFSKIYIDGVAKYVKGDLPALIKKIEHYYPGADFPVTID